MKKSIVYWCIINMMFCVFMYLPTNARGEELEFPVTEKEIIKILGVEPSISEARLEGRGGLNAANTDNSLFEKPKVQGTRGLGSIVDDEKVLEEAPKVGALVLFDYNSAEIKVESIPLLQEYGKALQGDLKDIVVVVAGHTDSKGSDSYNLMLSERRAESVKNFFVAEYHVDETRLLVKPYGEKKPLETNTTDKGRARNRRVEFIRIQ